MIKYWTVDGAKAVFRHPFFDHGKWRVRRRDLVTGKVSTITLKSENASACRREVNGMAERERRDAEELAKLPEDRRPKEAAFGDAIDQWLATFDVRPVTMSDYKNCGEFYKAALGADRPIGEIHLPDLERLFFEVWAHRKGQTKLKHRTLLVRFWKWAIAHQLARENLAEKIEPPKAWRKEVIQARRSAGQALTVEEARILLDAARMPYMIDYTPYSKRETREEVNLTERAPMPALWWLIFIGLRSGLRRSNIIGSRHKAGLAWRHLDLKEKVLRIDADLMKNGEEFIAPLHEELVDELAKLQKSLGRIPRSTEAVIPDASGINIEKAFHGALKRAGLGGRRFRIHDLRHSFASWLGERCTHSVMKKLLGHAAIDISDRYGKHQRMAALREGINSLPRLRVGGAVVEHAQKKAT